MCLAVGRKRKLERARDSERGSVGVCKRETERKRDIYRERYKREREREGQRKRQRKNIQ